MTTNTRIVWPGVLVILSLAECVWALEPLVLAQKSKTQVAIVVASDARDAEQYAASELAHFLQQITGATYEVTFQAPPDRACLFVGKQAAHLASEEISTDGLAREGIIIRSTDRGLVLTGDSGRGTLYAVYSFLEDTLGCRWWSSRVSTIPYSPTLSVKPMDTRYVPPLEYREVYWADALGSADWSVRNKCNGNGHPLDAQALIDEFLAGYYGPAGPYIGNYLDVMHNTIARTGDDLGCLPSYNAPVPKFLRFEPLAQGWIELKAAEAAVRDNPELLSRVKLAQLPVLYCFLRQWKPLQNRAQQIGIPWPVDPSIDVVYKQFMETAKAQGVTRLNEWNAGFGLLDEALKQYRQ